MTITIESYKVERLLSILQDTWADKRRGFTCLDAARLLGNLISVVPVCPWLQWSLLNLMHEFIKLLRTNHKRLARSADFKALLAERDESWMDPKSAKFTKLRLLNRTYAQQVWRDKSTTWISKCVREEIHFLKRQCTEFLDGTYPWY